MSKPTEEARSQIAAQSQAEGPSRPTLHLPRDRAPPTAHLAATTARASDLLDDCLNRLPWVGQFEEFRVDGGFGFVSVGVGGKRIFAHIKDRCPKDAGNIATDLRGCPVLFAIGQSQKDGRECAVQWALVKDVPWQSPIRRIRQSELDTLRRQWFDCRDLAQLVQSLRADWYHAPGAIAAQQRVLNDPILEKALLHKLAAAAAEDWVRSGVGPALKASLFSFADQWDLTSTRLPVFLLKEFSAVQLATLGAPSSGWWGQAPANLKEKLAEWALQSSLAPQEAQSWTAHLCAGFVGEAKVARSLLRPDWRHTDVGREFLRGLVASKKLGAQEILAAAEAAPEAEGDWLGCLPVTQQLDLLIQRHPVPTDLAEVLATRNDPALERMAAARFATGLDIESDGSEVWEIGVATPEGGRLLLSRQDSSSRLPEVLASLRELLSRSKVVVGHNVIAWDWPIISRLLGWLGKRVVLWDTMLVDFLLTPWKATYALGGSHQADEDAQDTFELFVSQLERIGGALGCKLLSGQLEDTGALMQLIERQVAGAAWDPPSLPDELQALWPAGKTLVVNPLWLRRVDWVPDTQVVSVDCQEPLPIEQRPLELQALERAVTPALDDDPFAVVLLGVVRKARAHHLAVRPSMLPLWLREREGLDSTIRDAVAAITGGQAARTIAPYPRRIDWYAEPIANNLLFLNARAAAMVVDAAWLRADELPQEAQASLTHPAAVPRPTSVHRLTVGKSPAVDLWVSHDPAAQRLDEAGRCYRVLKRVSWPEAERSTVAPTVRDQYERPRLLPRSDLTLHPGSQDQAAYWKDVVRALATVAEHQPSGTVPLLLVGSTACSELITLLEQGLCEVGLAQPAAQHQSRSERLRRAAAQPRACLVAAIDAWPSWKALSDALGVPLCPVLEQVPLTDWFAFQAGEVSDEGEVMPLASPEGVDDSEDDGGGVQDALDTLLDDPDFEDESSRKRLSSVVGNAEINAVLPSLVTDHMGRWLTETGLAESRLACVVVDPRLSSRRRAVQPVFDVVEWQDQPLPSEQEMALDSLFEPLGVRREEAPADYASMRDFLVNHWNPRRSESDPSWITDFRPDTQRPAMDAIRDRAADVLVTLPTGEGKSVLFQVPALCRGLRTRRLSIVISPLRALMRDQVQRLGRIGFHQSVDYLTADRPVHEIDDVYQGILDHRIVLLYVAPERFRSKRFADVVDRRFEVDGAFEYVVIDEAHCVIQWGYEFRPDYFFAFDTVCRKYRQPQAGEKTPLVLLSATVTAANQEKLSDLAKGHSADGDERYLPFLRRPDRFIPPIREHIAIKPCSFRGLINVRPKGDWPIVERLEEIAALVTEARNNRERTGQHSAMIVFVGRRDHAEQLSLRLVAHAAVGGAGATVDYFHAGLDAMSREEVYRHFLEGGIDVLVATKAFGMGMDIPHIHWAVHLAPPSFLEDYLQEVGRIGRGDTERRSARLETLTAALFHSSEDFEANRTAIQRDRIEHRQVADLYASIRQNGKVDGDGKRVVIMPDAGFSVFRTAAEQRAARVRVRKTLYWLERIERIEILAMMPGLIQVSLDSGKLASVAATGAGPRADVAGLLNTLLAPGAAEEIDKPSGDGVPRPGRSIVDRILDGLNKFIGFVLGTAGQDDGVAPPTLSPTAGPAPSGQGNAEVIVSLGQIWRASALGHVDDVLAMLGELAHEGALKFNRAIRFSRRQYADKAPGDIDVLFQAVNGAALSVIGHLEKGKDCQIDVEALAARELQTLESSDFKDLPEVLERAVAYLLRATGVRVRDELRNGKRALVPKMARSQAANVRRRIGMASGAARDLWEHFSQQGRGGDAAIPLSTLVEATRAHSSGRRFRQRDLRRNLGLLAVLRLISVSDSLVPMSYVLLDKGSGDGVSTDDSPKVWAELAGVNRLTELRGEAIEIFVHLPEDGKRRFIQGYFEQQTPEEMAAFLDAQLGEIEGDEVGEFIAQKREQLQGKAVDEFLKRYREAREEPNQWKAIDYPFSENLLVNAGPGSGKTSVLIARVVHLLRFQHIRPEEILVLAFNRAVVFEIRTRVKQLFGKLGFGAYVRRLNVSTFHAFAARQLGRVLDGSDDWDRERKDLLQKFAGRLQRDAAFRQTAAQGLRTILIDEFQDVNEDIYAIVLQLWEGTKRTAGVFAIGDDDQDVLGWNRSDGRASGLYFGRLERDLNIADGSVLTLAVNFRSGREIVEETQDRLKKLLANCDQSASRRKTTTLRAAKGAGSASIRCVDVRNASFEEVVAGIGKRIRDRQAERDGSLAILCRTNAEVAAVYQRLTQAGVELTVQGSGTYPLVQLRHIGEWRDLLTRELNDRGDAPLSESLCDRLLDRYKSIDIPEVTKPRDQDLDPRELWDLCGREMSYPYLSHLIEFLSGIDSGDLERLRCGLGGDRARERPLLSTIHKVKGLEFDEVLVMPSWSEFSGRANCSLNQSAAEEARLHYVALTRAKRMARYGIGARELAWERAQAFVGAQANGRLLEGLPKEVGISWAWTSHSPDSPDAELTLDYIRRTVRVGDRLTIGDGSRYLLHAGRTGGGRKIGRIAKAVGAGGRQSDLVVHAVLRCRYQRSDDGRQYFPGVIAKSVEEQGWGLVVLASGVLR